MSRSLRTWLVFGACMALGFAGLVWISRVLVGLERRESQARRQAELEERVRLALWRMDSALAPLVAQENARPYFHYRAYYPADAAYARMYDRPRTGAVLAPSPLLGAETPLVKLHFQIDPMGGYTSPELAEDRPPGQTDPDRTAAARAKLQELNLNVPRDLLAGALYVPGEPAPTQAREEAAPRRSSARPESTPAAPPQKPTAPAATVEVVASVSGSPAQAAVSAEAKAKELERKGELESAKNVAEFAARARQQASVNEQAVRRDAPARPAEASTTADALAIPAPKPDASPPAGTAFLSPGVAGSAGGPPAAKEKKTAAEAPSGSRPREARRIQAPARLPEESPLRACWIGDLLFLVRRVRTAEGEFLQGCWLDWPTIRGDLTRQVADLLPAANLLPARGSAASEPGRLLAALPLVLDPGPPPHRPDPSLSPALLALGLGWACALVFGATAVLLLRQAILLGDRRGAFVSAVTHELRTPLTTFRMYAELLHLDMVEDEAERKSLLQTLVAESDRLDHLVKNVLSYARLESGRSVASLTPVSVARLLERGCERLTQRAAQAGMQVEVRLAAGLEAVTVRTDPSVVEQILFNLVDNACKYAASDKGRPVRVEAGLEGGRLLLRVKDEGPGIAPADRRKLFRPFHKSAREAARSAPGVGLGLALSRRLAQGLGGELRLENGAGPGAGFVLDLPVEPAGEGRG